jgi:cell division protein FtsQ
VNPFDPQGEPIRQGVDESGAVFDPPGGLWLTDPVIRGEPRAIPEAVAVIASIPEDIERRVRDVQALSPDDIRLRLGNDAIVRWGNADEAEFKAEVLAALLPRRAKGYDVSAPRLPTTFDERGPKD